MQAKILVIACGAIAKELVRIRNLNNWVHIQIQCLPADLHNTPHDIPAAVKAKIQSQADRFDKVFVAYADCGTGGRLDSMLDEYGIERIPGAHCYEFYAGSDIFHQIAESEPGTFYLTDFLARHFERLVVKGLGLDQRPQLKPVYFGNYKRVVYLAQTESGALIALLDKASRAEIERRVRQVEKVETALDENFQQHFVDAMGIPHASHRFPNLSRAILF
jgi:hypothetical protein